jgi:hypothetical protein
MLDVCPPISLALKANAEVAFEGTTVARSGRRDLRADQYGFVSVGRVSTMSPDTRKGCSGDIDPSYREP